MLFLLRSDETLTVQSDFSYITPFYVVLHSTDKSAFHYVVKVKMCNNPIDGVRLRSVKAHW